MMQTAMYKRIVLALIACLTAFCLCFTVALATGDDASQPATVSQNESAPVESVNTGESAPSQPVESGIVSSEPTPVSNGSEVSSTISQTPSSLPESQTESTASQGQSEPASSQTATSQPASSQAASSAASSQAASNVTSQESAIWFNSSATGSFVYDGSYQGLASSVNEEDAPEANKPSARSSLARRYANYATIGMVVFALAAIAVIVWLIVYNRKVSKSKKLHPEWYADKNRGKHDK